jgi:hypothetical protein
MSCYPWFSPDLIATGDSVEGSETLGDKQEFHFVDAQDNLNSPINN